MFEGCLSYPGKERNIRRSKTIDVEYYNGKEHISETLTGMIARIFQHEYDHLNGKPCINYNLRRKIWDWLK